LTRVELASSNRVAGEALCCAKLHPSIFDIVE